MSWLLQACLFLSLYGCLSQTVDSETDIVNSPENAASPPPSPLDDCDPEMIGFELITGNVFSAPGHVLDSIPGTLMLTDCLETCQGNESCQSINYETGLCVLFSSTADALPGALTRSQFPVFTIYAQKSCLGVKPCERAWCIDRVQNHRLNGYVNSQHTVGSRQECLELCLGENEFSCSILVVTVWICYFIVYSENKYIDKNIEKTVIKSVAKSIDGEMGNPVILPNELPPEIFSKIEQGWKDYQFNVYVSDMINLHRSLPDHRNELCMLPFRYEIKLPTTSIIISFYNEAWSVLLRSIYSILERTPPRLIKEIILVDDFSDMPHLKKQLEDHLESETKVKIIRNEKREGLIRSRLIGSDLAQGEILIFLDSHIEVTQGWLEPLLERIRLNYTNVACPIIDMINPKTFEYVPVKEIYVGGFDWNLIFTWHQIPQREVERRYDEAEPVFSPTMSGIFAISKRFFEEIGRYDDGLEIWGGDNLELSFKIWMCGGNLEIIPCSRVGHIFRQEFPYNVLDEKTHLPVTMENFQRVAETWLDEYKTFYYQRIGNQNNIYDDLKERQALRISFKCESFRWYLDKIYPEKFVPKHLYGYGLIGTVNRKYCLDSWGDLYTFVQSKKCLSTSLGGSQFWYYTNEKEIRKDDVCLEYNPEINDYVSLYSCDGIYDSRQWDYDPVTNFFIHINSEKCMGIDGDEVVLTACDYSDAKQQWFIENVNSKTTS